MNWQVKDTVKFIPVALIFFSSPADFLISPLSYFLLFFYCLLYPLSPVIDTGVTHTEHTRLLSSSLLSSL